MATETLRPNAAGDETSIAQQTPGTGFHWDKVDDVTPDEDDTTVWSSSQQRDLYNIPNSGVGAGTINFIKIYFRWKCWGAGYDAYCAPSLKSNSTVTDGTEVYDNSGNFITYSQQWNTNPADAGAWEWADINALQIGVRGRGSGGNFYVTQVYVEIDYTVVGWTGKITGVTNPAKIMGVEVANIAKVKGVEAG